MSLKKWLAISAACFAFAAPGAWAQESQEYSVSTVLSADFPWGQAAEKWAELVEERTDGRIKLKVYPNSQLVSGDQTREFSAMRSGIIDMAVGSTINLCPQDIETKLYSLALLMSDDSAVAAITNGKACWMLFEAIESHCLVPLSSGGNCLRKNTNSNVALSSPDDLKDLKSR